MYSDARKRLVEELGIEPGSALKELEQAILRQDPALELPATRSTDDATASRARRRGGARTRRCAPPRSSWVSRKVGPKGPRRSPTPTPMSFYPPQPVSVVREAPIRDTVRLAYDDNALWSISADGEVTRLDPARGEIVATLGLGVKPAGLTVGEGSVWVTGRALADALTHRPVGQRDSRTASRSQ